MTPEAAVLYATAGPPEEDERIRELVTGSFSWEWFLWLATRERASAVARRRLQHAGVAVPAPIEEQLQRQSMVADFTAARLETRLAETVAALRRAGIEPVLLKGAALATAVYHDFRERPMGDLDLLVQPEEVERSVAVAEECGWESAGTPDAAGYERHHHLPPMADRSGAGSLELHTGLFVSAHSFPGFREALYAGARPEPQGSVPSDVHLVIHLCTHLAWSHMLAVGSWRSFHDLWTMIRHDRIDWGAMVAEARRYGATSSCYWTLTMAAQVAGVPVPPEVLGRCRPPGGAWLHRLLYRQFASHLDTPERWCPTVALRRRLWRIALRPRWSGHQGGLPWEDVPTTQRGMTESGPAGGRLQRSLGSLRYLARIAW